MNIWIGRPLLARSPRFIVAAVLALAPVAWGAGTVTNATQAALQAALNGGGTVKFATGGVITLTNTIIIAQDTVLDAAGFDVTISGGNAVRLFQVNSNVAFSANGLTLANGSVVGANGVDGSPPDPGQDGLGAGILNLCGRVALTGCALTNHSAQGGNSGFGIVDGQGVYVPGGNGFGAALCNLGGIVSLTNCLLAGNSTLGGSSPAPVQYAHGIYLGEPIQGRGLGAAVYSANGQVQFQGVTFTSNNVTGGPPLPDAGGEGVTGAAGEGFGGAIYATNSGVLLSGSVLGGNSANGGCTDGLGGALCLDQGSSGVIRLCRFLGNAANGVQGGYLAPGGNGVGGAIFNGAELQIWDSTFSSNSCVGGTFDAIGTLGLGPAAGAAQGGAICSTNALIVNGSTFDSNLAQAGAAYPTQEFASGAGGPGEGGAIWSSGALAATNSTWTTNQAAGGSGAAGSNQPLEVVGGAGSGGALCIAGGQATLLNVTVAGNSANGGGARVWFGGPGPSQDGGPSQGGGLYNTNGAVTVINSIIADSLSGGDVWGTVTDGGYNICSDGTAGFSVTGSLNSTKPLLGPLAENGGPSETMALLPGSPALDAIPSGFPPVDQRGVSRPQLPLADIGAFESLAGTVVGALWITLLPGNSVAIQFLGVPGTTYDVEASADLVHWTAVGVASAGTNSGFEFIDPAANLSAARFYRTRVP
ncbi:MAG TPA: choice-of-anchor Q domain-containing protein [Dongiaceae bacterium]|nr:choice-of-anchor Q domain-containing protein [Dongiaceae bacterium]